jgi:hypothetical protein
MRNLARGGAPVWSQVEKESFRPTAWKNWSLSLSLSLLSLSQSQSLSLSLSAKLRRSEHWLRRYRVRQIQPTRLMDSHAVWPHRPQERRDVRAP